MYVIEHDIKEHPDTTCVRGLDQPVQRLVAAIGTLSAQGVHRPIAVVTREQIAARARIRALRVLVDRGKPEDVHTQIVKVAVLNRLGHAIKIPAHEARDIRQIDVRLGRPHAVDRPESVRKREVHQAVLPAERLGFRPHGEPEPIVFRRNSGGVRAFNPQRVLSRRRRREINNHVAVFINAPGILIELGLTRKNTHALWIEGRLARRCCHKTQTRLNTLTTGQFVYAPKGLLAVAHPKLAHLGAIVPTRKRVRRRRLRLSIHIERKRIGARLKLGAPHRRPVLIKHRLGRPIIKVPGDFIRARVRQLHRT